MIEFKRFCLYVLPLFLSSALADDAGIRKNIHKDYNLMQNLLIEMEQESATQVEKKLKMQDSTTMTTDSEDQKWIEDQIGTKQAAPVKVKPIISTPRKIRKRSR